MGDGGLDRRGDPAVGRLEPRCRALRAGHRAHRVLAGPGRAATRPRRRLDRGRPRRTALRRRHDPGRRAGAGHAGAGQRFGAPHRSADHAAPGRAGRDRALGARAVVRRGPFLQPPAARARDRHADRERRHRGHRVPDAGAAGADRGLDVRGPGPAAHGRGRAGAGERRGGRRDARRSAPGRAGRPAARCGRLGALLSPDPDGVGRAARRAERAACGPAERDRAGRGQRLRGRDRGARCGAGGRRAMRAITPIARASCSTSAGRTRLPRRSSRRWRWTPMPPTRSPSGR